MGEQMAPPAVASAVDVAAVAIGAETVSQELKAKRANLPL